MKVVYIASPYRSSTIRGTVENIRRAETVAIKYWKLGYAVICPHLNTALFDGILPDRIWILGDLEILTRCDVVVFCEGWSKSPGCNTEMYLAKDLDKEIIFDKEEEKQGPS